MEILNKLSHQIYDISEGDRFYFNNFSVRRNLTLPDYLVIKKIHTDEKNIPMWIEAVWENHYIHTKERLLSVSILEDSNLNPLNLEPKWVFVKKSQNLQPA